MAPLDVEKQIFLKLLMSHRTRAHAWLPYPLFVVTGKIDSSLGHVYIFIMTLKSLVLKILNKFLLIYKWRH